MNFYKHHLGDYDGATMHLTWDEDMAYTRLLRAYYRREKCLPKDEVNRLVRAATSSQRQATLRVLGEFFILMPDGWHNKRADEEIEKYQAQASTNRRIARQRTVNEPSTIHIPNQNQIPEPEPQKARGTPAGTLSAALRALGVIITPSNPVLVGWMEAGASEGIIREAVEMARERKPEPQRIPAAYLDPIVRELLTPTPSGGNGSTHHAEPVDGQCQQFADGERCKSGVTFWNRSATKGNCAKHGPF